MRTLVSCLGAALVCVVIVPGTAVAQSADEARIRAGVVADRELRRRSTCYTDL